MTTLRTPRLTICPLTEADLPALVAYRNDPEVARYQGWTLPYTLELAQKMVSEDDLGAEGWVQRMICTPQGDVLGDVGLNRHGEQAEVGITLISAAQGQGYASEALRALLDFAFRELDLHRVHAGIDPRNMPVSRLLTRLGFRHEGTHLKSYCHRGSWTDEAVYALLQTEWIT